MADLPDDAPVREASDVARHLPSEYKNEEVAVARDALVASLTAAAIYYQDRSKYAAAQSDIATATERYLIALAADRGIYKADSESDDEFRERVLAIPDLVSPNAIMAAVNAVLSAHTDVQAQYFESIQDRAYLRTVASPGCATILGGSPSYASRLYPEDEAANGGARPQSSPGGARLFNDRIGRFFLLRVPDLSPLDSQIPALYPGGGATPEDVGIGRIFLGTGIAAPPLFLRNDSATAVDVYRAIASAVDSIRGHSIRWRMISDSSLN